MNQDFKMLGDGNYNKMPASNSGPASSAGAGGHPAPSGVVFREGDAPSAFNIAEYWRLALKHRLLILGSLLSALVLGAIATFLMTPLYTASTTLQIDREAARIFAAEDAAPRESLIQGEEFFQTQYGILRSRALAERVVSSLGLASSDAFLVAMGVPPPERGEGGAAKQSETRRQMVVQAVLKNLEVSPIRGSRLALVTFTSPDPGTASRLANAYADNFIQSNLDRKFESSKYARQFLEERIAQTKAKLEDAERELVAYAGAQQIINVREAGATEGEQQSLTSTSLVALNDALTTATAARIAAEQRWREAQRTPIGSQPEVLSNASIQRLGEERAKLSSQYQQKLSVYRPDYPEMVQLKNQIDELDRQVSQISRDVVRSIRNNYTVAANQERALQSRVNRLKGDVLDLRNRTIQYTILQREVDTSRALYDGLLQRYKEVGVTGGISTNNISIVDRAQTPGVPSSPNLLLNLIVASFLGLGFGVTLALAIEALDETLASPEDVEAKLGVPVLGTIPKLARDESPLDALKDVRSPFSEAYYSLRTALQFSTPNGAPRSILVTSSRPAEGKSTTAFATAQSLARVGRRVLLVDGDLRNPSLHRLIDVDNIMGMSNLLSGAATLAEVTQGTTDDGMSFIPCGPLPPNPAELWGGDRLKQFLTDALSHYDHVVIDGPPVLGFADSPLLASHVEGSLFAVEARGTRRGQAKGALRRLQFGHARLLGVVLTKFSASKTAYGSYDYAYDYEYGQTAARSKELNR